MCVLQSVSLLEGTSSPFRPLVGSSLSFEKSNSGTQHNEKAIKPTSAIELTNLKKKYKVTDDVSTNKQRPAATHGPDLLPQLPRHARLPPWCPLRPLPVLPKRNANSANSRVVPHVPHRAALACQHFSGYVPPLSFHHANPPSSAEPSWGTRWDIRGELRAWRRADRTP